MKTFAAFIATAVLIPASAGDEPAPLPDPLRCRDGELLAAAFFIMPDCPVSNALMPEMNRIVADFKESGVRFTFVYVDPEMSDADRKRHAEDYGIAAPSIIDATHAVVRAAKAEISPQAVVASKTGAIVYSGRINDLFYAAGRKRGQVGSHDLRNALEAAVAGREIATPRTEAIGCYIADLAPAPDSKAPDGSDSQP